MATTMFGGHQTNGMATANSKTASSAAANPLGGGVDSNVTLWQFLLELLAANDHTDLIQWTNNVGEFILHDAEAVASLWGIRKCKPNMNYDKLCCALRYYYDKNIINKVIGLKFVYRFVMDSKNGGGDNGNGGCRKGPYNSKLVLNAISKSGLNVNGGQLQGSKFHHLQPNFLLLAIQMQNGIKKEMKMMMELKLPND